MGEWRRVEYEIDRLIDDIVESFFLPDFKQNPYKCILSDLKNVRGVPPNQIWSAISTMDQIMQATFRVLAKGVIDHPDPEIRILIGQLHSNRLIDNRISIRAHRLRDIRNSVHHCNEKINFAVTHSEYIEAKLHLLVILWYCLHKFYGYRLVFGNEVTEKMIGDAIEIDRDCYTGDNAIFQGTMDACLAWYKKNPEIYTMIVSPEIKKVIGYINMMPIREQVFEGIKRGNVIDMEIPADDIICYEDPIEGALDLYLCSAAIRGSYRVSRENPCFSTAFLFLYRAFTARLLLLAEERKIFFRRVIADAITESGIQLCDFIGMKKIMVSGHGSVIYTADMTQSELRLPGFKGRRLKWLYRERFGHAPAQNG